jgi:hypothetical protein
VNTDYSDYIYISGPMRGHDDLNFPAFFEAEECARKWFLSGAHFLNPAREDMVRFNLTHLGAREAGLWLNNEGNFTHDDLRSALADDLAYIAEKATILVTLPGWEESKGARAEVATANALGIHVLGFVKGLFYNMSPDKIHSRITVPQKAVEVNEPDPRAVLLEETRQAVADAVSAIENAGEDGEVRTTSASGGQKGMKLAAFDQVSPEVEMLVAEHFGKGARKYSAHNFRKGYEWSKSYSALRRHLAAFWAGEEYDDHTDACDPDCVDHTGSLHIVAVIWHAMVLTEFYLHHREYDDRFRYYEEGGTE